LVHSSMASDLTRSSAHTSLTSSLEGHLFESTRGERIMGYFIKPAKSYT
jgi:hypothetical protein